ncbi:uncharacterized protein LOC118798261 [Colossoma macropomum]|uniref:uncharacterized protein LOC118798261 n=1 Tax=Colossoma macropomum TaxID=42526 RepID=UPI001865276B|nr:uncharacterized protein LOC118798261 [Colossoma macropomum]
MMNMSHCLFSLFLCTLWVNAMWSAPVGDDAHVKSVDLNREKSTTQAQGSTPTHLPSTMRTTQMANSEHGSNDTVVILLNLPIDTVNKSIPDIKKCLVATLGWNVIIISIWSDSSLKSSSSIKTRTAGKTYISFVALSPSGSVIDAEKVKMKLKIMKGDLMLGMQESLGITVEIVLVENQQNTSSSIRFLVFLTVPASPLLLCAAW